MNSQNLHRVKLSGFTLLEQIIVLALTTILVLIGFTSILNFQNLIAKIKEVSAKDRSIYLLHDALENDFRKSELIKWDGVLIIENAEGGIRYQFESTCLIRQTKIELDTFRFIANDIRVKAINENLKMVESISFNLSDNKQSYKMSLIKKYPEYKIWEYTHYGN